MAESHPLVTVFDFDHVNLRTRDMTRSIDFYTRLLGLPLVRYDTNDHQAPVFASLRIGGALIDLQPAEGFAQGDESGMNHFCLLIEATDMTTLRDQLVAAGVPITEGPVQRQGAYGYGTALYIRDPDGHGIELKHHDYPVGTS